MKNAWKWWKNTGNLTDVQKYKCGIIERIEGWFKGLGIRYRIEPKMDKCLMHVEGKCAGQFLLNLK